MLVLKLPKNKPQSKLLMSKPRIAIGPEMAKPSWDWVGFDLSRELTKYYDVEVFPLGTLSPPECDLILIIKNTPRPIFLNRLNRRKNKTIYLPIDNYQNAFAIERDKRFLGQCDSVLVHCERLIPVLTPFCKIVEFIEHHNRFGLDEAVQYKSSGYAIWVGSLQYLQAIIEWLQRHPLGMQIKFVVNYPSAFREKLTNALPIRDPHEVILWTPQSQREAMVGAKAAFDIKGTDFNQMHKAPVKAQKFIASGIPFAVNPESYSAEYFKSRGLEIPDPTDTEYWLSKDYWENIQPVSQELRTRLTLENVGLTCKHVIDSALGIP